MKYFYDLHTYTYTHPSHYTYQYSLTFVHDSHIYISAESNPRLALNLQIQHAIRKRRKFLSLNSPFTYPIIAIFSAAQSIALFKLLCNLSYDFVMFVGFFKCDKSWQKLGSYSSYIFEPDEWICLLRMGFPQHLLRLDFLCVLFFTSFEVA